MLRYTIPFWAKVLLPGMLWEVPRAKKQVFLTFDDGPVPGPTDKVLEILKAYDAKATFFCVGENITKHPETYQKVLTEGHSTGNHTYNHLKGWDTDTTSYLHNVKLCADAMKPFHPTGLPVLFRPPYGKCTLQQAKRLRQYKIVMWSVLSRDFDQEVSAQKCLKMTQKFTRSGSIVVFHDSVKTIEKLEIVLPQYLQFCKEKEYKFSVL